MNQRIIIPRVSRDETTFAVVEFGGVKREELKNAIQRAITDWVRNSEDGRRAFAASGEDFNVGDLAEELPGFRGSLAPGADPLAAALIKQGLTYPSIDTYCDDQPSGWEFDDHLTLDE
jgi:hypothetical protein